jgi:hypothetical protein
MIRSRPNSERCSPSVVTIEHYLRPAAEVAFQRRVSAVPVTAAKIRA